METRINGRAISDYKDFEVTETGLAVPKAEPLYVPAISNGYAPDDFIIDDSLVLYLPLYLLKGSKFKSVDRYKHSCEVLSALWRPDGRRFTNDHINIDSALTPLASDTAGTWMMWVKLDDATPSARTMLISFAKTAAGFEFISLGVEATSGVLRGWCYDGGSQKWQLNTDAAALSDGVYAHLALVQDGTSPILLVNGVQVAQTFGNETDPTVWFSVCTALDNGRIGSRSANAQGEGDYIAAGNVGEVWAYNRALSAAEIIHNCNVTRWRY